MSAHDDDDPGFWPGYVAAVSGLVQGLLIMTMALGISIYALGQLAKASGPSMTPPTGPDEPLPPPRAAPLPRLMSEILVPQQRAPLPAGSAPPAETSAEPVIDASVTPPAVGGKAIRIAYLGDAVTLPRSSEAALGEAIDADRKAGAAGWRVVLAADLDVPRERRAGYLRLMSVRSILLKRGVPAEKISVDLIAAKELANPPANAGDSVTAELLPLDESGRALRTSSLLP